jgi:hypothetical protein
MLRHAPLGRPEYYSFIATNLTTRGLHCRKEITSIRYLNIESLFTSDVNKASNIKQGHLKTFGRPRQNNLFALADIFYQM